MRLTTGAAFLLLATTLVEGCSLKYQGRHVKDLHADVQLAQCKIGVYIQRCLQFSAAFQTITEADVQIEVNNAFEAIYDAMDRLQVSSSTVNQIRYLAQQDLALLSLATQNLLEGTQHIMGTAYQMNWHMRSGSLAEVAPLYEAFANQDTNDFNYKYNQYLAALAVSGNSLRAAVLNAIKDFSGPDVGQIHALLQLSSDVVNLDLEAMSHQMIYYVQDFYEASNAIYTVIAQVPSVY